MSTEPADEQQPRPVPLSDGSRTIWQRLAMPAQEPSNPFVPEELAAARSGSPAQQQPVTR